MIDYAKTILPKVSPWKELFLKELRKCVNWTDEKEYDELVKWCYQTFYDTHGDVLKEELKAPKVVQHCRKIPENRDTEIIRMMKLGTVKAI